MSTHDTDPPGEADTVTLSDHDYTSTAYVIEAGLSVTVNLVSDLDADHVVPQGRGGPNTLRNKTSLCRRCHEAKHGERGHAPTVRCLSTGDMAQKDFSWFVHFWNHLLPALTELALEHRVEPLHNLADEKQYKAWHIPVGELRRLDEALADRDNIWYLPRKAHRYM